MEPQIFTLKNGLRVIFIDTKAFPTLTTILLIGAGSRYENKHNNGVTHFFEHMAFKGSKKYPNSFIISSTIEGLGGIFNAFTSKDQTSYWMKSTNEHFGTIIDVLSDMVLNPLLAPEEIEREKGVIVEEINMYKDTPQRKVGDLFENLLYQKSSLGYDIIGSKKTVVSFQKHNFVDYIQQLYHPKNAVLVVAGGLGSDNKSAKIFSQDQLASRRSSGPLAPRSSSDSEVSLRCSLAQTTDFRKNFASYLSIIEEKFKDWRNGEKVSFQKVKEKQTKPELLLKYKKTEQTHFCLGFRAFSFFDKRKYALSVLSTILGGGMSSRLFIEVRERRGLCYYISTGRELYHDVGNLVTQAGVANNINKVKEAIEVILKEHKKISQGEIKREELKKAKELIKGRLLLSLEDSFSVASFFGMKKLLEDRVETPQEVINQLNKVKVDDVVNLALQLFIPSRLNLALIGPFNNKEDFTKELSI